MKVKIMLNGKVTRTIDTVSCVKYNPLDYRSIEVMHGGTIDIVLLSTGESLVIEEVLDTDN